jgi:hypothetical protein
MVIVVGGVVGVSYLEGNAVEGGFEWGNTHTSRIS